MNKHPKTAISPAWLRKACDALDEILYGRELARIRWHQERIDEIRTGQGAAVHAYGGHSNSVSPESQQAQQSPGSAVKEDPNL